MPDRSFPDRRHEAKPIECMPLIEVHRSCVEHFFAADVGSQVSHSFNWTDTKSAVEPALKSLAARGEEVAGPPIKANAIDEVRGALCGFQIMFVAGVVGIANAAISVSIVDAMLAPDLTLTDMNAFVCSQKSLILSVHEADRKSTRLNSSHLGISYAVFCLK